MKRYPFKFLDAYTRDDRDIFFGREEEVEALYQMVFQTDLMLVYGASGTGKTSLIMCGLAAKGGDGAPKTLFAGSDELDKVGWYRQNSGENPLSGDWDFNKIVDNNGQTHPVKSKLGNSIALFDMSGNIYEWCWDWYASDYYEKCRDKGIVKNPTGAESSEDGRVLRGGSWDSYAELCRVALRFSHNPGYRRLSVGFRLVFVP